MQECCRFCERLFTSEQIKEGIPLPTFRGQHYRLVEIAGTVHKFQSDSTGRRKKTKSEEN